ncbi:UNVERIFIED_CONTAM: hypothetical protein Slati_1127300 [Sesamum latifolium]|uniref:Gag-pol polyprotein n=1 Tax=Sesamum latifolium TaxID=2727402 RepID=A0AAW2XBW9_9LAMI
MSKNPLTAILEANIFNRTNYNDLLSNLRIVLDFENQTYVLDRSLPWTLPEESTHEERLTFKKWHEDNRKVHSIVLVLMTNDIQKQYDRHDDVQSIMLSMSHIYAIPDRHIRYAAIKVFFGTKIIKGSSVQEHRVKMHTLVEKLKDLKADLAKETYIDVILQSLPPSFDSFIVNYNLHRLDKDLHELINMLVQYEATIEKSAPSVLVREASTSKAKGKGPDAGGGRRVRQNQLLQALRALLLPRWAWAKERGRQFDSHGFQKICINCREKGHWKREYPKLLYNQAVNVISANSLQVVNRSRRLRQTVLKLCNGMVVATMVVGLSRLSY